MPGDLAHDRARRVSNGIRNLKFVGCHLGGGICEVIGRMDYAYELGDKASGLGSYEPMLITKKTQRILA
jgi:hypothetical protein